MLEKLRRLRPGIKTIEDLHEHLQFAIELEHSTIPPYLCALYSLQGGKNQEAAQIIRSVVMEEMLHIMLAANVLNAIGGHPSLNHPDFIPEYPTTLPLSNGTFLVHLQKFSPPAIKTFLQIEQPAKPHAPPEPNHYKTIGQFYAAIKDGLRLVCRGNRHFTGDLSRQVRPEQYYGGGGEATVITDLKSALSALDEIVAQGEGVAHTIFDGDKKMFGQPREYAHFFRFNEIHLGRHYTPQDTPKSGPTGPPLPVAWDAVYDMQTDPKVRDYPAGSELRRKAEEFNQCYSGLLDKLHRCFNGEPGRLWEAVGGMYDLKYQAVALMKIPAGEGEQTAGPSFEYAPC